VLYYGDEIGMGDNIHLGDRDGVRTPMQWSIDRNGGFSRADPAALVLPPLSDPLYGFQAINVEAQQRDTHSLLNWTRRMLAVRRRYQALGRGSIRLVYPGNRRILAYLREYGDETLLCVANLSRTMQAVELDLGEFEDAVPVDTVGGTAFPPVGKLPYLLTLPPFGFYQFQLVDQGQLPDWHVQPPEPMPEYHTLVLRGTLADALAQESHRALLEREVLPAWLARRRWYAGHGEADAAAAVRIRYVAPLAEDLVLLELEADGACYFAPLGIAWEHPDLPPLPQQLALARVRRVHRVGFLTDAFSLPALGAALVTGWRQAARLPAAADQLVFAATPLLEEAGLQQPPVVRWLSLEQTNSSLVLDEAAVLKLVRRLTPGVNPEAEIAGYLAAAGYANTAPLLGELLRVAPDGTPTTLAVLQGNIPNQGDAWRWTLDFLSRQYDEWRVDATPARLAEVLSEYDIVAAMLGTRLAELHTVLALPSDDPAFAPQPADAVARRGWVDAAREGYDQALAALQAAPIEDWVLADRARRLTELRDHVHERIAWLAESTGKALLTRVHGDFHLGQVLVAQGDVYLIDFEGEPARPLAERRAKSTPLRDVAGLLRSFDYAAALFGRGEDGVAPVDDGHLEPFLEAFRARARQAFSDAYLAVAVEAPQPWADPSGMVALVDLFALDKAAYEVRYEAAHRPAWIGVPAEGLLRLVEQLVAADARG
jgi:maltose alpha-D-glucosyltransferase/alpha-amylase